MLLRNLLNLIAILFLILFLLTFFDDVSSFFSKVTPNGWLGFLGSVFSVAGAYWVAGYFYSKQSADHFSSELENTRRRVYVDKEKFNGIYQNTKVIYRVPNIYKQKGQSELIHYLIDHVHKNINELDERLESKTEYHTYVMNNIELLREYLEQISYHLGLIKKYYNILGRDSYGEGEESNFKNSLDLLEENLQKFNKEVDNLLLKLNIDKE